MIRVKVIGPFGLTNKIMDERGWVELPEGTTLGQLIRRLGLAGLIGKFLRPHLNGMVQPSSTVLKDKDIVSFFSPIRGG